MVGGGVVGGGSVGAAPDPANSSQSTFTLPFTKTSRTFCTPLCAGNVRDCVWNVFQPPVPLTVKVPTFVPPINTRMFVLPPPLATLRSILFVPAGKLTLLYCVQALASM